MFRAGGGPVQALLALNPRVWGLGFPKPSTLNPETLKERKGGDLDPTCPGPPKEGSSYIGVKLDIPNYGKAGCVAQCNQK